MLPFHLYFKDDDLDMGISTKKRTCMHFFIAIYKMSSVKSGKCMFFDDDDTYKKYNKVVEQMDPEKLTILQVDRRNSRTPIDIKRGMVVAYVHKKLGNHEYMYFCRHADYFPESRRKEIMSAYGLEDYLDEHLIFKDVNSDDPLAMVVVRAKSLNGKHILDDQNEFWDIILNGYYYDSPRMSAIEAMCSDDIKFGIEQQFTFTHLTHEELDDKWKTILKPAPKPTTTDARKYISQIFIDYDTDCLIFVNERNEYLVFKHDNTFYGLTCDSKQNVSSKDANEIFIEYAKLYQDQFAIKLKNKTNQKKIEQIQHMMVYSVTKVSKKWKDVIDRIKKTTAKGGRSKLDVASKSNTRNKSKKPITASWVSIHIKVAHNGSPRTLYQNSRTGDRRVKTMVVIDGKRKAKYVKPKTNNVKPTTKGK